MQNPGRDQPQDEFPAADIHGVAGVVAALKARDDVELRRQQIDDLALAFVAPLGAQYREIHIGPTILPGFTLPRRIAHAGATRTSLAAPRGTVITKVIASGYAEDVYATRVK